MARERDFGAPAWGGGRPGGGWGGGRPQAGWGGEHPQAGWGGEHPQAAWGGERPAARPFFGYGGGYRPGPAPQMVYRGVPGFGGYARPRLRDPDDWNDYGSQRVTPGGWRRGQVFPQGARGAVVADYGRYHLRRPPPGYYWYRSGDDFILAAIASGLIFEVVPGDGY
ncbi:MAG: RcnB family protein [Caulobacteraceae bacterium]|nr:RcnB family protein [Caulobacteraceae bacterium]